MRIIPLGIIAALAAVPTDAAAFCGFYIDGAGKDMFADATQVVLVRKGTRTVLSMQNDYKGPPDKFAIVIPVPVVLHRGDVKTIPADVIDKVDAMGAPRLVEYWEEDPCATNDVNVYGGLLGSEVGALEGGFGFGLAGHGVTVEDQFDVGEYEIVILSAKESTGLATWLRQAKYQIPDGVEPLLRPYVAAGMKFFVAKVDPKKVKFAGGRAALSPLRFHYDSDEFSLPIRLGLASSSGTQDLIVSILSPGQRFEVANRDNVTISTNLDVRKSVRGRFGDFYAALFDATMKANPGAVVTEYAWQASTCDPCPGDTTLETADFELLGDDVLDGDNDFVLTRLHARYDRGVKDDLVFRVAPAIAGGREERDKRGRLERGATKSTVNNFQARYAIRNWWTKPIKCARPVRGVWGGPPDGDDATPAPAIATKVGLVARGAVKLERMLVRGAPEIGVKAYRKPRAVKR